MNTTGKTDKTDNTDNTEEEGTKTRKTRNKKQEKKESKRAQEFSSQKPIKIYTEEELLQNTGKWGKETPATLHCWY